MFAPCYLDFNATTPLDARVLEVMLPYLQNRHGNPSSRHEYGRQARNAVELARQQLAQALGAQPGEVVFTSGGSEANNLFVKGAAASLRPGVIAIGASEHPCVRQPALQLRQQGWQVLELPLHELGDLDVLQAQALIGQHRPALISVMSANNETGALNDVQTLAQAARAQGAFMHTDAVQALGKVPLNFRSLGVHAMTVSSHKIGGPQGVGALILDKRLDVQPLIAGGGQERGLRSGTENVAAIVGFGKACELMAEEFEQRVGSMSGLRAVMEDSLSALGAEIFARGVPRLPNTSFFAFKNIDGETLVGKLDRAGFAVASGAACSSANPEPSRSLLAMGVEPAVARGAVRVSLGAGNSLAQIESFLLALKETLADLKGLTAVAI
ncbi:cysteine desulfurase family protein [Uliginosibacterium gangwonense]|uniref:cysteine desulfurase family protein n=1 Tax=Uliginosibacterium gangwonense TaxID=392736 RepID=UPI00036531F4|nr:aminotransferase class V-fold PLP-dependent enzyme [Uliginosibacterium gangwonense]